MIKYVQVFLDRLTQRLVIVASRLVASSVESLHATQQAAEQSQLEDLARQYEADGKMEIAATLRRRATQLADASPAEEAMETLQSLMNDGQALPALPDERADNRGWPPALPSAQNGGSKKPPRKKGKRSKAKKNEDSPFDDSIVQPSRGPQ